MFDKIIAYSIQNNLSYLDIDIDGASSYIFITDAKEEGNELKFEAIRVIVGITDNGFSSIKLIDSIPEGMKILTDGSYYVYAQSKAGELEHEH